MFFWKVFWTFFGELERKIELSGCLLEAEWPCREMVSGSEGRRH